MPTSLASPFDALRASQVQPPNSASASGGGSAGRELQPATQQKAETTAILVAFRIGSPRRRKALGGHGLGTRNVGAFAQGRDPLPRPEGVGTFRFAQPGVFTASQARSYVGVCPHASILRPLGGS